MDMEINGFPLFISKDEEISNWNSFTNVQTLALDCESYNSVVCILQIALLYNAGGENKKGVFIFDLLKMSKTSREKLSKNLVEILSDSSIIKLGQGFQNDMYSLQKSYPEMECWSTKCESLMEMKSLYRILQPMATKTNLRLMVKEILNINLSKAMQKSNWSLRPLSKAQLRYASLDALILIDLFDAMTSKIKQLEPEYNFDKLLRPMQTFIPHLNLICTYCPSHAADKIKYPSEESLFNHSITVHYVEPEEYENMYALYNIAFLREQEDKSGKRDSVLVKKRKRTDSLSAVH